MGRHGRASYANILMATTEYFPRSVTIVLAFTWSASSRCSRLPWWSTKSTHASPDTSSMCHQSGAQ